MSPIGRAPIAVIEDQGRAPVPLQAAGELAHHLDGGRRPFEHVAWTQRVAETLFRLGAKAEDQAISVDAHQPLAPAALGGDELANRQRIEELVGDEKRRARRHVLEPVVPFKGEAGGGEGGLLPLPQGRARLDEMHGGGRLEVGQDTRRAQQVGHQRAAPRSELDEAAAGRAAHGVPDFHHPQADQLAEHLADLGRRGEIAGRAEGIAGGVVVPQAQAHVALDRDRPVEGDDLA